jgi:hypothetical protein
MSLRRLSTKNQMIFASTSFELVTTLSIFTVSWYDRAHIPVRGVPRRTQHDLITASIQPPSHLRAILERSQDEPRSISRLSFYGLTATSVQPDRSLISPPTFTTQVLRRKDCSHARISLALSSLFARTTENLVKVAPPRDLSFGRLLLIPKWTIA